MYCSSLKKNKGFTMVEIVLVLVVLAILAAIIIPVTLSIVDSSRQAQIAIDAKDIWQSVQTSLNEQMATDKHYLRDTDNNNKRGAPMNEKEMDSDWTKIKAKFEDTTFAFDFSTYELSQRILKKIENEDSYQFIYFVCGRFYDYYLSENEMDKAYTSYMVIYKYFDDDKTYYYNGSDISNEWAFLSPASLNALSTSSDLRMNIGGKSIKVQLYSIKKLKKDGKTDSSGVLTYFKNNAS
ncbi:MAG: prepilin-type N-terminal cleavage/methylation domain-containing protein [Lachnospiraceae bacterium]|nr:prepilin-type N-terminal cleavage/methylation domain-containing protein [Lachnospiraceae bacterium]